MGGLQQAPDEVLRQRVGPELVAHVAAGLDGAIDGVALSLGERTGRDQMIRYARRSIGDGGRKIGAGGVVKSRHVQPWFREGAVVYRSMPPTFAYRAEAQLSARSQAKLPARFFTGEHIIGFQLPRSLVSSGFFLMLRPSFEPPAGEELC